MATFDVNTDGGGTYLTLSAALAALPVTPTEEDTITLIGSTPDTTQVDITAAISDRSTFPLNIVGDNGTGIWSSGFYSIEAQPGNIGVINYAQDNIFIDGVQVFCLYSGTSQNRYGVTVGAVTSGGFTNGLIRANLSPGVGLSIDNAASANFDTHNTIIFDWINAAGTAGFGVNANGPNIAGAHKFTNLTIVNCGLGFRGNASAKTLPIVNNVVCIDCPLGAFEFYADPSSSNNASSDGSHLLNGFNGGGGGVTLSSDVITDYFVSASDFHINPAAANASELIDAGVAVAGYTDDIDGDTRTGSWDIGADEIAAAPTTLSVTVPNIAGGANLTTLSYCAFDGMNIGVNSVVKQGNDELTNANGDLSIDMEGLGVVAGTEIAIMINNVTDSTSAATRAAMCFATVVDS